MSVLSGEFNSYSKILGGSFTSKIQVRHYNITLFYMVLDVFVITSADFIFGD